MGGLITIHYDVSASGGEARYLHSVMAEGQCLHWGEKDGQIRQFRSCQLGGGEGWFVGSLFTIGDQLTGDQLTGYQLRSRLMSGERVCMLLVSRYLAQA
jgi:hypothetical protein